MPHLRHSGLDTYADHFSRLGDQLEDIVNGAAQPLIDRVVEDTRAAARAQGWSEDEVQEIHHWAGEGSTHVGVRGPFAEEAARREYGDETTPPTFVVRQPIARAGKHYDEHFSEHLMKRLGF